MGLNLSLSIKVISTLSCALVLISSCKKNRKDCPAFSENLVPYIPNESRLMFYNADGDSLLFRTDIYNKTEQHTEIRNVLSVGGSASKPYCRSSCSMNSSMLSSDANQIDYSIEVDDEADTCSIRLSINSVVPSIDYFLQSFPFATSGKVLGDTLRLTNYPPTLYTRFSAVTIVYGRGIVSITDDVEDCVWSR